MKRPTSEITNNSRLFVLVADAQPERLEYRELLPDSNVQWGFVAKPDIFTAALHLQPWDVILVDQSMLDSIPTELLVAVDFQDDSHDLILILDADHLPIAASSGLLATCGYVIRNDTLRIALARILRRHLHIQSLDRERQHLENEISRILEQWEQSIRDRTDKLERTNRALQAADEMKSRFLANVSHQLRTPLTVVRSYTDLLMKCPPEAAQEHHEFLTIISSEAARLSRMIDDLLDLARLDAGGSDWHLSEVSLRDLVQSIATAFSPVFQEHNVTFLSTLPESLPHVRADADRLIQVFNNLLLNCVEALGSKGGSVEISAEIASESQSSPQGDVDVIDLVRVHIDDSGPGIAPNDRQRVFNRFEQGQRARKNRGAGLGLAICREIIEKLQGHIWAADSPTGGCRITFTLPVGDLRMLSDVFSSEVLSVVTP